MSTRRKSESSEGDDRPRKRRAQGQEKAGNGLNFACPFYKRDPIHNLHCLYRNQLTTPSFARQHVRRYHNRCPDCGSWLEDGVDHHPDPHSDFHPQKQTQSPQLRDLDFGRARSKDGREGQCGCQFKYQRGKTEDRWYDIFTTLFPGETPPDSPYIGSPEDEIVRMALDAIGQISPDSNRILQLESLKSWSAVSSILKRASPDRGLDQTPSEVGSHSSCGPPTPSNPDAAFPAFATLDTDTPYSDQVASILSTSAPAANLYVGPQGINFGVVLDDIPTTFDMSMGFYEESYPDFINAEDLDQSNLAWNDSYSLSYTPFT